MYADRRMKARFAGVGALVLLMFSLSLNTTNASAEITSLAHAINKAGRQRMLSQRIVKAYCLVGLGVQEARAREQLARSIELFEQQFQELKDFAPDVGTHDALARVAEVWPDFRARATEAVSRDGARLLNRASGPLVEATDSVVMALAALSDQPYGRLVNVAGRQRMLSQRLAKNYLLRAWQFNEPLVYDELERTRNEFEGALAELRAGAESRGHLGLREELGAAEKQWIWMKSVMSVPEDTFFPLIVEDASEKTLQIMENVVQMYQDLASPGETRAGTP